MFDSLFPVSKESGIFSNSILTFSNDGQPRTIVLYCLDATGASINGREVSNAYHWDFHCITHFMRVAYLLINMIHFYLS